MKRSIDRSRSFQNIKRVTKRSWKSWTLMQIRDEELDKELLAAFHKSGLSYRDAISLLAKIPHQEDSEENES